MLVYRVSVRKNAERLYGIALAGVSHGDGEWSHWERILVLKGCTSTFQFVHKPQSNSIIWQLAFLCLIFNPQVGVSLLRISSPLELFTLHNDST